MFNITANLDKVSGLCQIIDAFSRDAHFDYQIVRFAQSQQNLLEKAEQFDVKDEELFNQLETFLSGYKELADALKISAESLSEESLQELGDLVNTLETRYQRLITNPILDVSPDQGYDEDFDPADFREFVADMMEDANNRLQAAAGDVDVSQLKGLEIAKELNQEALDKGDLNMRWTGDKVQQALDARKKHLDKVKFRRRFARGSAEYQKLIETSRRNYQTIMADPARREVYREKSRERQSKFLEGLTPAQIDKRKSDLENELATIDRVKDPEKWEFIRRKINTIELYRARQERKTTSLQERRIVPSRDLGDTGVASLTLTSLIQHLTTRIATQKVVVKQKITDRLKKEENSLFKPYKDAIIAAKTSGDKAAEAVAIKQLNKALNDHAENEPSVMSFISSAKELYAFRDKLKELDKSKWLERDIPAEVQPHIQALRTEGLKLAIKYRKERHFGTIVEVLDKIEGFISQRMP